jgi:hypothetical protein
MPYKKVEPIEESNMRKKRYLGHHTVCEKLREIWRIGKEIDNPEIQFKAREASAMAKRMHEKLKEYAKRYHEEELLENIEGED